MGESRGADLQVRFDRRIRMQFQGAKVTTDAGLVAVRELDEALGLTELARGMLADTRTGRNVQHDQVALLRQSVYSRLAGYEDTNDAARLAVDPAMRAVVGRRSAQPAASTNTLTGITHMVGCYPQHSPNVPRIPLRFSHLSAKCELGALLAVILPRIGSMGGLRADSRHNAPGRSTVTPHRYP